MPFEDRYPARIARAIKSHWHVGLICYTSFVVGGCVLLWSTKEKHDEHLLTRRAWGGYDERPMSEVCYRQERVATLLAIFLGCLGVDQFYAHHWVLAVFKLLTLGFGGLWSMIDVILWCIGGIYGTPGCLGGYH